MPSASPPVARIRPEALDVQQPIARTSTINAVFDLNNVNVLMCIFLSKRNRHLCRTVHRGRQANANTAYAAPDPVRQHARRPLSAVESSRIAGAQSPRPACKKIMTEELASKHRFGQHVPIATALNRRLMGILSLARSLCFSLPELLPCIYRPTLISRIIPHWAYHVNGFFTFSGKKKLIFAQITRETGCGGSSVKGQIMRRRNNHPADCGIPKDCRAMFFSTGGSGLAVRQERGVF